MMTMIIIIICEVRAWPAPIHRGTMRNKFMIPKGVNKEESSSPSCPCEENYMRMEWSLNWTWAGSGCFPSEQGQTHSGDGISQRGKLPFGQPSSWEMGQGPQLGQKRVTVASGLPAKENTDSSVAFSFVEHTLEILNCYWALQILLSK